MAYLCPVCGCRALEHAPYDKYGRGSDEICPSCGFHYKQDKLGEAEKEAERNHWRGKWVQQGCPWFSKFRGPPPDWSPVVLTLDSAETAD